MNIRHCTFLLTIALMVLGLTGCGSSGDADVEPKVTLRLWANSNTTRPREDLQTILQRFEEMHPGVEVQIEILDWTDAFDRIRTAAISGTGPDVVQLGTTWVASIAATGALLPLDTLLDRAGSDTIFEVAARPVMRPLLADGAVSFPWFLDVRPLYLRTDLLDSAGVQITEFTTSHEGFLHGLRRIRDAGFRGVNGQRVYAIGLAGKHDWNLTHTFYPWIRGAGGAIVNAWGDSVLLDSEASVRGILNLVGLIREDLTSRAYLAKNTSQVSTEFDEGRIAVWQETTSKLVYLQQVAALRNRFTTAVPPPGPVEDRGFLGGSHLAVFRATSHPAAAQALLLFLTTDSAAVQAFCQASGMTPALRKAFHAPFFTDDPHRAIFSRLVERGEAYPAVPYWGELETRILNNRFGNIFDIAAETSAPYSEKAVREQIRLAAAESRELVTREILSDPERMERLRLRRQGLSKVVAP